MCEEGGEAQSDPPALVRRPHLETPPEDDLHLPDEVTPQGGHEGQFLPL